MANSQAIMLAADMTQYLLNNTLADTRHLQAAP